MNRTKYLPSRRRLVCEQDVVVLFISFPICPSILVDGGFDDVVGAGGEDGVGVLDAAERVAVGYQMGGVDLAFRNQLHDFVAVAGIHSAGLESEVLAIHPRQRQYLFLLV